MQSLMMTNWYETFQVYLTPSNSRETFNTTLSLIQNSSLATINSISNAFSTCYRLPHSLKLTKFGTSYKNYQSTNIFNSVYLLWNQWRKPSQLGEII